MFNVDPSVPIKPNVLDTVNVFDVVPPATENPVVKDENETPLIVLPVNAEAMLLEAIVPEIKFPGMLPVDTVPNVVILADPADGA
jgi:hypothetical protein